MVEKRSRDYILDFQEEDEHNVVFRKAYILERFKFSEITIKVVSFYQNCSGGRLQVPTRYRLANNICITGGEH